MTTILDDDGDMLFMIALKKIFDDDQKKILRFFRGLVLVTTKKVQPLLQEKDPWRYKGIRVYPLVEKLGAFTFLL